MIEILQGDCLEVLKTLPDASVQMCVTSPPYYGLRDYGTATWEGGDPDCDHVEQVINHRRNLAAAATACDGIPRSQTNRKDNGVLTLPYKQVCGKCGATRIDQQIGLESSVDAYVAKLVEVFREVRRCLKPDGVIFVNLGDSYNSGCNNRDPYRKTSSGKMMPPQGRASATLCGIKPKDLIGIPWRVAFALQADGYYLRQDLIWHKPNAMPESVKDRCTKAHEYIFLLSKSPRYYFDAEAIKEPASQSSIPQKRPAVSPHGASGRLRNDEGRLGGGSVGCIDGKRNRRSVWSVPTTPLKSAHFAVFPAKLIEPCILAGSRTGDVILDPFGGAGTTALVARAHGRQSVLIELNADYIEIAKRRLEMPDTKPRKPKRPNSRQSGLFEPAPAGWT